MALFGLGAFDPAAQSFADTTESDRVAVLEEKLDRSLKLIESLAARVHELELERADKLALNAGTPAAGAVPAAGAPPVQASAVTQLQAQSQPQAQSLAQTQQQLDQVAQQVTQMADANAARRGDDTGLPIHGFADIDAGNNTSKYKDLHGFDVGGLDLFLNPKLGEHTRALFEMTFEVSDTGDIQSDVERAQLGYQFSDAATIWVGRFHTPFGYYNTAFHHGQQIATSLRRPRFIMFEDQGGVMPNHTVGAWLTGSEHVSDGKVTYDLFAGNGQKLIEGAIDTRSGGVDHGGAIFGGNLGYVFGDALSGLKVGASGFRSRISDDQQIGRITRVDNVGVYFAYDTDNFEHIGEFYRFHNTDLSDNGRDYRSNAGFIQLAWRLPILIPYVRFERAQLNQDDSYFALQLQGMSYRRAALGLRYDIDVQSALKFELAESKNTDRSVEQWTDALLQYAIRF